MEQDKAQEKQHIAIIVAAGRGERMKADKPKVFLKLGGVPVIAYTVKAFEDCPWIDAIILVAAPDYLDEMERIAKEGSYAKIRQIVPGGESRADSVYAGLRAANEVAEGAAYVYIHDGARPFVTQDVLERVCAGVEATDACICGMPVKDTIRTVETVSSERGTAEGELLGSAPDRSALRAIQTPQVFDLKLVTDAYQAFFTSNHGDQDLSGKTVSVTDRLTGILTATPPTDDAQMVEQMTGHEVYLVEGSYRNIKLTTPEDMVIGEALIHGDI